MATGRLLQKRISNSRKLSKLSSDGARLLYTWILCHLDSNGNFYGDPAMVNNLVFTRLNKPVKEVERYIDELVLNGLAIRYEIGGELYLNYPDFFEKQPNIRPDREGKCDIPNHTPESIRIISGSTPPEYNIIEENRIYSQVIDYLNLKSGKEFKVKCKGTQRHIEAREKEGFIYEDFCEVIDFKVDQWKNDKAMSQYIRPETLFGTKFEGYLQEAKNGRGKPKPNSLGKALF